MTESMPPAPMAPPPAAPVTGRPTGATVISIIETVLGVLLSIVALGALFLGSIAGGLGGLSDVEGGAAVGGILAGLGFFFGIIAVLLAVLYFAIAYGVWKGRPWAWTVGVVVSIIGLVFAVLGLTGGITVSTIISLALPIVVLYYLMQPEVKRWLGRPA
jgi:hypothetical protein